MDYAETEPVLPCADKLVFETREQALGGAAATQWHYGTSLKPYKCPHCGLWHLSSN